MLHRTDLLTIGELSARSGFASSALRYYENLGLITSTRTSGNQRRYERAMLRRLAFIRSAQRVGLSLEEITQALRTLPGSRTPTKADWTRSRTSGVAGSMSRSNGWSAFGTGSTAASAAAA